MSGHRVAPCPPAALAALIALPAAACAGGVRPASRPADALEPPAHIRVRPADGAAILRLPIEQYVRETVLSEVAPSGDRDAAGRMLQVQAILVRTYALSNRNRHRREGFDLCATTHCQVFDPEKLRRSPWAAAVSRAVEETAGTVVWYRGAPAQTLYHADCGGRTSDGSNVWGGSAPPYLDGLKTTAPRVPRIARGASRWTQRGSELR